MPFQAQKLTVWTNTDIYLSDIACRAKAQKLVALLHAHTADKTAQQLYKQPGEAVEVITWMQRCFLDIISEAGFAIEVDSLEGGGHSDHLFEVGQRSQEVSDDDGYVSLLTECASHFTSNPYLRMVAGGP